MARKRKTDRGQLVTYTAYVVMTVSAVAIGTVLLLAAWREDDVVWGTAAEWVGAIGSILVGLLAAAFAYLAWQASKRAVRAEERAVHVAEQALASEARFEFVVANGLSEGATVLSLRLDATSPTAHIAHVSLKDFYFADAEETEIWVTSLKDALGQLPTSIPPGGSSDCIWRHEGYGPMKAEVRPRSYVIVDVHYAVSEDKQSGFFVYPSLYLNIPDSPRIY